MLIKCLEWLFPYPSMCLFCHEPLEHLGVCPSCSERLERRKVQLGYCSTCNHFGMRVAHCQNCKAWQGYPFRALSRYPYEKEVKETLIKFKFHNEAWRGKALGGLLAPLVDKPYDVILPVPLHKARLGQRGYNQSLLLAKGLSACTKIPLDKKSLIRIKNTPPQRTLSKMARRANVKGAFLLKTNRSLKDKDILLIDDIMTTGATLFACAKVLLEEGEAGSVTALTLASGIS